MLVTPATVWVRRECRRAIWRTAAAVAFLGASARAADAPAPSAAETTWYGWQTLLPDVGAIGLWSLAAVVDDAQYGSTSWRTYQVWSTALTASGFAAYVLGAPAIHLAHGRADKAGKSLAMRIGFPFGGALVGLLGGLAACDSSSRDAEVSCPVMTGVLGFVAGGVAAMVVDAVVVARTPAAALRFQAVFVPRSGGGTFVLGGRF